MTILVTGAAGFIGAHLCRRLLARGERVVGVDTLNAYYDPSLKQDRLRWLEHEDFQFFQVDVSDAEAFRELVLQHSPEHLIHLAAQAGVRYSLEDPFAYESANVRGQLSVLEAVRHAKRRPHLIYASSSSVYGDRPLDPARGFSESDPVDRPVSVYAATKRAAELLSGAYAHLFEIGSSALRFFTVYGPYGRPDMAYFDFTDRMLHDKPIEVFGEGRMARDFTYIDDVIDGITGLLEAPAAPGAHRVLNVGGSQPRGLMEMISILEDLLGVEARKIMRPMQPGDVTATFADVGRLNAITGYRPRVPLEDGLAHFVQWRRNWR